MQPCQELSTAPVGTTVGCPFDYHVLHSEQLGLGPCTNNIFTVLVADGKVVSVEPLYEFGTNGQLDLFEAIGAWVRENHLGDWASMESADGHTRAEMQRWYPLWKQYSQEYADAMTQEVGGGSAE